MNIDLSVALADLSTISSVMLGVLLSKVRNEGANGLKIGTGAKVFISVFRARTNQQSMIFLFLLQGKQ